jgi:hypothetical protein
VVEGAALEKRCAGNRTEGSNPSLSAKQKRPSHMARSLLFGLPWYDKKVMSFAFLFIGLALALILAFEILMFVDAVRNPRLSDAQ